MTLIYDEAVEEWRGENWSVVVSLRRRGITYGGIIEANLGGSCEKHTFERTVDTHTAAPKSTIVNFRLPFL